MYISFDLQDLREQNGGDEHEGTNNPSMRDGAVNGAAIMYQLVETLFYRQ